MTGDTERCPVCGEPAERLPEDLRGRYETPDGEGYWGYSGDYFHRGCAELTIEQIESGQEQTTLISDGGHSTSDTDRDLRRCRETGSVFVLDGPNVDVQVSACPNCGSKRCLNTGSDHDE